jgi:hypothetical protein
MVGIGLPPAGFSAGRKPTSGPGSRPTPLPFVAPLPRPLLRPLVSASTIEDPNRVVATAARLPTITDRRDIATPRTSWNGRFSEGLEVPSSTLIMLLCRSRTSPKGRERR